jgi:hypothetical protein
MLTAHGNRRGSNCQQAGCQRAPLTRVNPFGHEAIDIGLCLLERMGPTRMYPLGTERPGGEAIPGLMLDSDDLAPCTEETRTFWGEGEHRVCWSVLDSFAHSTSKLLYKVPDQVVNVFRLQSVAATTRLAVFRSVKLYLIQAT